ncbi:hypothetical protein V3C99_006377 [Haemonchus contortus]
MWTSHRFCQKLVFLETNMVKKALAREVHRATSWPAVLEICGLPRFRGYFSSVTGKIANKAMSSLNGAGDGPRGKVLSIAGCTNSGKTTLTKILCDKLMKGGATVHSIHQDEFFYTEDKVEKIYQEEGSEPAFFYDYDSISAVDRDGLINAIREASLTYDYTIVEGNMVTELSQVIALCDRIMFLMLDKETCHNRRIKRTYDPPDMPGYFEKVVWPSYRQHLSNALYSARRNCRFLFLDANTTSGRPDLKFMNSLIQSFLDDAVHFCYDASELEGAVRFFTSGSCEDTSLFVRTTPDTLDGRSVLQIEYAIDDEYAYKELQKLCRRIRDAYPGVERVGIFHRIGDVSAGEKLFRVAISSSHQNEASKAIEMVVDEFDRLSLIRENVVYMDDGSGQEKSGKRCTKNGCLRTEVDGSLQELNKLKRNGEVIHADTES